MSEYTDCFGRNMGVGDFVVYAATAGRSATLRAGRVVALSQSKGFGSNGAPTVKLLTVTKGWRGGWSIQNGGSPVTILMLRNLCGVPAETLPPEILTLLKP